MQIFPFVANTTQKTVSGGDGVFLEAPPLVYGDDILLAGQFVETVNGETSALDLSGAATLRATVRQYRRHADDDNPILTYQYSYNQGEFPAGENLGDGLVTWALALAGDDLLGVVDAAVTAGEDGASVWLEISATLGGKAQTLAQFQIQVVPQLDDGTAGTPPPASPTYPTTAEVEGMIDATYPATEKTTVATGDRITIWDSAAGLVRKYISPSNLLAWIAGGLATVFSAIGHNHDADYSAIGHNHDADYSAIGHNHDADYAAIDHNHDADYSAIGHNHDASYADIDHTHDAADLTYTPAVPADWDTEPDDVAEALDELAARIDDVGSVASDDTVAAPAGTTDLGTVYRNNSGAWLAGDPDDGECETCELWIALGTDPETDGMTAEDVVVNPAWSWTTVGGALWLDDSGALTETVPTAETHAGRVARIVGWVRSATSIRFDGHVPGDTFTEAVS